MLNIIKEYIGEKSSEAIKIHRLREFLQYQILDAVSCKKYFQNIAFLGGTALRLIYKTQRYSEDLDFSLVNKNPNYNFDQMIQQVIKELELNNFIINCKFKKNITAVRSCFLKFSGLLYQLGLSPLKDHNINIKFEVDENPPLGFATELSMTTGEFSIAMNHFDRPSLFAGKLHAILSRPYPKGRDYFDLLWFTGNNIEPNLELLCNALQQSAGQRLDLDINIVTSMLQDKISSTDFKAVVADLRPFIFDEAILEHYTRVNFLKQIERWRD